jgi:hypothetical protein
MNKTLAAATLISLVALPARANAANFYDSRGILVGELVGKAADGFGLAVELVGNLRSGTPPSLHFIALAFRISRQRRFPQPLRDLLRLGQLYGHTISAVQPI